MEACSGDAAAVVIGDGEGETGFDDGDLGEHRPAFLTVLPLEVGGEALRFSDLIGN